MGKEPLTREEYNEAVDAYIDEFRTGKLDETTFRERLKAVGMDRDEVDYVARTNR